MTAGRIERRTLPRFGASTNDRVLSGVAVLRVLDHPHEVVPLVRRIGSAAERLRPRHHLRGDGHELYERIRDTGAFCATFTRQRMFTVPGLEGDETTHAWNGTGTATHSRTHPPARA